MSDDKKWFKMWTSLLSDPDFNDLSNDSVGIWTKLGALVAKHGDNGTIIVSTKQICRITGLSTSEIDNINLGNINVIIKHNDNSTYTVIFNNWRKYQIDSTGYERLKKWRKSQNDNDAKTKTKTKTKKKKKNTNNATLFSDFWKIYPNRNGRKVGKATSIELFKKIPEKDIPLLLQATKNYAKADTGYSKDPERFLKKDFWKDWIEEEEQPRGEHVDRGMYTVMKNAIEGDKK